MKPFLIKLFIVLCLTDLGLLIWRVLEKRQSQKVLSFNTQSEKRTFPSSIPTVTPTPLPTVSPTPLPTPKPSLTPTPTPKPQPKYSQAEIHGFIERFSAQYSVDPNVLRHIAVCESGFRVEAVNGPYVGLYQFGKSAWKNNRLLMGEDTDFDLRFNAEEAVQTAAFIISRGIKNIWPNCYP